MMNRAFVEEVRIVDFPFLKEREQNQRKNIHYEMLGFSPIFSKKLV